MMKKSWQNSSGVHSHVLEDWPFITPTDICTLDALPKIYQLGKLYRGF